MAGKLETIKMLAPYVGSGVANSALWDYTLSPYHDGVPFTGKWDPTRVGNTFANFLLGVSGMAGLKSKGKMTPSSGITALGFAPFKDLAIHANPALGDLQKGMREIGKSNDNEKLNTLLAGLGVATAGGLGYMGLKKLDEMNKPKEDEGAIHVTLPTKDPNDNETVVKLPMSTMALSQTAKDNLERDIRRRLRSGAKERTRRRDPNTGELLTMSEYKNRYAKAAAQHPQVTAKSPFQVNNDSPGPRTGAEQYSHGARPIQPIGPVTQYTPVPEEPAEPAPTEEPKPNPHIQPRIDSIAKRIGNLQGGLSKMALVKAAESSTFSPWNHMQDVADGKYNNYYRTSATSMPGKVLGGLTDLATTTAAGVIASPIVGSVRSIQKNTDEMGANAARAWTGLNEEGEKLNAWQRAKEVGSIPVNAVQGVGGVALNVADGLFNFYAPKIGIPLSAATSAFTGFMNKDKPKAGETPMAGETPTPENVQTAPALASTDPKTNPYQRVLRVGNAASGVGRMFGVNGFGMRPTMRGYQGNRTGAMDMASQIRGLM